MANGRCRLHGGKSKGPLNPISGPNNPAPKKHGIYSKFYSDEEKAMLNEVTIGSLENEIEMVRTMLYRATKQKAEWDAAVAKGEDVTETNLHLYEVHRTEGTKIEVVGDKSVEIPVATVSKTRRRPDYEKMIKDWTALLDRLERSHKELQGTGGGGSVEERAREILETVDEMDNMVPDPEGDDEPAEE